MTWDFENANIDDYGGGGDKRDHLEGMASHARWIYRALQGAQGSAYSKSMTGLLHAENLADARSGAAAMRAAEKLETNSFPSRADDALQYWVNTLGVSVGSDDTNDDVRRKAQARYQSGTGNHAVALETAVGTLLGSAFVAIYRNGGVAIDTPSLHTYWPGVNPGPITYDLDGSGAWYSDNAHILVVVTEDRAVNLSQIRRLFNVDLVELLDRMLPAWVTFEWAYEQCFLIEESGIGEAAICES